jgi:hypothetical protein
VAVGKNNQQSITKRLNPHSAAFFERRGAMAKFFYTLQEYKLITEWAEILDWLLDDNRFSKERGWDKNRKDKFTKALCGRCGIEKKHFIADANKRLNWTLKRPHNAFVQMQEGGSKGKDLITHIRNGIAHGHNDIIMLKGELWIEIKDYNPSGKQTAYLLFPMKFINELHKLYKEIEQSSGKTAAPKPKQAKKQKAALRESGII